MTVTQLREQLRQGGLTVSGKKSELIKRLMYSARAKQALISPTGDESKIIQSAKKQEPSSSRKVLKRPISRPEPMPTSTKKLKLTQETISSSLRKGFPISTSSRPMTSSLSHSISRKRSPISRKKSPTASSTSISVKKTPISRKKSPTSSSSSISVKKTPRNQVGITRTLRKSDNDTSQESIQSVASLPPSNRLSSRRKIICISSPAKTIIKRSSKSKQEPVKENTIKSNASIPTIKTSTHDRNVQKTVKPLSTITNSAKKRRSNRRASMAKSVNKALMQLEQLEQII